jgi:hypothetical protein
VTVASWTTSAPPSPAASLLFVSVGATSLALRTSASGMGSAVVGTDDTASSLSPSPETFGPPDVGGGGTARLAAARLGSGGAPGPVAGAGDAGLEEGANGDDTDVFPRRCNADDGRPSDGDITGAGDPARERLNGLAGRDVGGGDAGEERRERERGMGDVARAMGVGVVGVMGSGTVCGEGGGR